ncbi:MAG: response regulator [Spirulina sp. SIO3F2]|nr:response regulator [Spirulina sp. SIO3F2]
MASHKVLILDSNTADRTHLRQLLPNGNYEIAEAGNGQEGLALIHQERGRIRFILLDARLPQINGWEIVQHLQADPSLDHIPLVMMVEQSDRPQPSTYPFLEVLTKPFNRKQLKQVVKSAIQKAKAAQAQTITAPPSEPIVFEPIPPLEEPQPTIPAPADATPPSPDEDLWSGFHSPHKFPEDFPEEFQQPPELPELPDLSLDGESGDWEAIADTTGDDLEVYTTSDEDQTAVSGLLTPDPPSQPRLDISDAPDELMPATEEISTSADEAVDLAPPETSNIFEVPAVGQFTEESGVSAWDSFVEIEPELPVVEASELADLSLELPELETAIPEGDPFALEPEQATPQSDAATADLTPDSTFEDNDLTQVADFEFDSAFTVPTPASIEPEVAAFSAESPPTESIENPEQDLFESFEADFAATESHGFAEFSPEVDQDTELPTELMMADEALASELPEAIADSVEPESVKDFATETSTSGLSPTTDSLELDSPDSLASNPFVDFEAELRELEQTPLETDASASETVAVPPDSLESEPFTDFELDSASPSDREPVVDADPFELTVETTDEFDPFADFEADFDTPDLAVPEPEPAIEELNDIFTSPDTASETIDPFADFETDFDAPESDPVIEAPETVAESEPVFAPPAETLDTFNPFADPEPESDPEIPDPTSMDLEDLMPTAFMGAATGAAMGAAIASASPAPEELATAATDPPAQDLDEPEHPNEPLKPVGQIEFNPDDRPSPLEPEATLEDIPELTAETTEKLTTEPEDDPFADLDLDSSSNWLNDPQFQVSAEGDGAKPPEIAEVKSDTDLGEPRFEPDASESAESITTDGSEPFALDSDPFAVAEEENTILGDKYHGTIEAVDPEPIASETPSEIDEDNTILSDNRLDSAKTTDTSALEKQLDAALTEEPEYTVLEDKREDGDFAGFAFEDGTKHNQRPLLNEGMVTLRGFEEVKMRFESAITAERIAAMHDAIAYDEPGYQLIFQALREESGPVREAAEQIVSNRIRQSENSKPLTQQAWLKMECLQVIMGHSYWVQTVAIADDNRTLVTGSKDSTIKTWDLFTGQELRTIRGHNASVLSIALSPESGKIISSSTDNTIKVWDFQSGEPIQVIDATKQDRHHKIYVVALSPDGKTLISASAEQSAKPKFENDLEGLLSYLPSKSISPLLGVVSFFRRSREIKLWDVQSGKVQGNLLGYSKGVTDLAVTPKGDLVVSGSRDHTVKVWDLQTKRTLNTLWGHTDEIRSVTISPDGKTIVSGSRDKTIKIWDLRTGHVLRTLRGHSQSVTSVAISPDGKTIVSGSRDATLKIWDFETGEYLNTLMGHTDLIRSVAISPDGQTIASGSRDNTIRVWRSL